MRRNHLALVRAHALRTKQTPIERVLWKHLRNRQLLNYKFRRQASIGPYIVDFLCVEKKFILEIDGDSHATQRAYDHRRDEFLRKLGYRIVRIENHIFHENMTEAIAYIAEILQNPHPNPLP